MNTQTVKPELKNPEMKEAYVAAHWGQSVLVIDPEFNYTYRVLNRWMSVLQDKSYLLLTPLEHITDEDAIELASLFNKKVFGVGYLSYELRTPIRLAESLYEDRILVEYSDGLNLMIYNDFSGIDFCDKDSNLRAFILQQDEFRIGYQYLQSKGYALRWGKHSVEELIAAGYCQLKGGGDE